MTYASHKETNMQEDIDKIDDLTDQIKALIKKRRALVRRTQLKSGITRAKLRATAENIRYDQFGDGIEDSYAKNGAWILGAVDLTGPEILEMFEGD